MILKNLLKKSILAAIILCMFLTAACGGTPSKKNQEDTEPSATSSEKEDAPKATAEPDENKNDLIAKVVGVSDENGIYAVQIYFSEKIADKGKIELVFYGPKGSAQENSVVNNFKAEYWKEDSGKYEIRTFWDGEVYQNYHKEDSVYVKVEFGASVRGRNVTVSYTPDGDETRTVYQADAEIFYRP